MLARATDVAVLSTLSLVYYSASTFKLSLEQSGELLKRGLGVLGLSGTRHRAPAQQATSDHPSRSCARHVIKRFL
jgi:hypothetical protein